MWQRVLERRLVASASCGLKLFKRPCARGVRVGLQLWIRPDRPPLLEMNSGVPSGHAYSTAASVAGRVGTAGVTSSSPPHPQSATGQQSSDQHAALPDRPHRRTSRHAPDHRVAERASNAPQTPGVRRYRTSQGAVLFADVPRQRVPRRVVPGATARGPRIRGLRSRTARCAEQVRSSSIVERVQQ